MPIIDFREIPEAHLASGLQEKWKELKFWQVCQTDIFIK